MTEQTHLIPIAKVDRAVRHINRYGTSKDQTACLPQSIWRGRTPAIGMPPGKLPGRQSSTSPRE